MIHFQTCHGNIHSSLAVLAQQKHSFVMPKSQNSVDFENGEPDGINKEAWLGPKSSDSVERQVIKLLTLIVMLMFSFTPT